MHIKKVINFNEFPPNFTSSMMPNRWNRPILWITQTTKTHRGRNRSWRGLYLLKEVYHQLISFQHGTARPRWLQWWALSITYGRNDTNSHNVLQKIEAEGTPPNRAHEAKLIGEIDKSIIITLNQKSMQTKISKNILHLDKHSVN